MKIDLHKLNRINIIATSGSGKTSFSKELSSILNIKHTEMDALYWKNDWKFSTNEELFEKLKLVTAGEKWILDGNYGRTQPIKWQNVQTIIWIDYSFKRTFYQVVKRSIIRALNRKSMWNTNNKESLRRFIFSKESIIYWMISGYSRMKKRHEILFQNPNPEWQMIRLQSPKATRMFLKELTNKLYSKQIDI